MQIGLAQIDVIAGNPKHNFNNIKNFINKAKNKNVDLVAFPEMCVGGYLIGDLYRDPSFIDEIEQYNNFLREESKDIAIAFGSIYREKEKRNKDGRFRLYNAVHIYVDQKPAKRKSVFLDGILPHGITFKTNLPTYRFFDDERYFFSMFDLYKEISPKKLNFSSFFSPFIIPTKEGKKELIGFELCEDMWCQDYFYKEDINSKYKNVNPTRYLSYHNPKAIVNLSASPWTYGKRKARHNAIKKLSKENFSPLFYVNCTGAQNNGKNIITFDGGTTVYNKNGDKSAIIDEPYIEELLISDPDNLPQKTNEKNRTKIEEKYLAIIRGLKSFKDYSGLNENPTVVIGLSGGIDSSVSACLLTKAFGKHKIIGINIPTKFNSELTKSVAESLSNKLEIEYRIINIDKIIECNKEIISEYTEKNNKKIPNLVLENMQAKIRGTNILSNIAQIENGIWSNNGNKIEMALGYATLYGDWGGAISPLGDLTKAEVYDMAKYLNSQIFKKEVISRDLLPNNLYQFDENKIKPSAELKTEQIDPIKISYHCSLVERFLDYKKQSAEDIMRWWLDGTLHKNLKIDRNLIFTYRLNEAEIFLKDLEWFYTKFRNQVFKRVQSVPVIITSKTAFGYDLRESMLPFNFNSLKINKLKRKIKKQKYYKTKN